MESYSAFGCQALEPGDKIIAHKEITEYRKPCNVYVCMYVCMYIYIFKLFDINKYMYGMYVYIQSCIIHFISYHVYIYVYIYIYLHMQMYNN